MKKGFFFALANFIFLSVTLGQTIGAKYKAKNIGTLKNIVKDYDLVNQTCGSDNYDLGGYARFYVEDSIPGTKSYIILLTRSNNAVNEGENFATVGQRFCIDDHMISNSNIFEKEQQSGKFNSLSALNDQRQEQIKNSSSSYYVKLKEANEQRIKAKKEALDKYHHIQDSTDKVVVNRDGAYRQYSIALREDYLNSIDDIEKSFQTNLQETFERQQLVSNFTFFPGRNSFNTMLYYNSLNGVDFFKQVNLNYWSDNASFSSEVVSGYLGILKIELASVISKSQVQTIDNSTVGNLTNVQVDSLIKSNDSVNRANSEITKVISGGGEVGLNAKIPLFDWTSRNGRNLSNRFQIELLSNFSLGLPAAASYVEKKDATYFYSAGFDITEFLPIYNFKSDGKLSFDKYQALALYAKWIFRGVNGSEKFYENLGTDRTSFIANEINGGIAFKNLFFYYSYQKVNIDKFDGKNRFGIKFIKNI